MTEIAPRIVNAATIVPVSDVARTVAFYRDVLGFDVPFQADDGSFAAVSRGPAAVQLVQTDSAEVLHATANNISIYVTVVGLDALYEELKHELEALPDGRLRAPFDQPYGMREFHVKDPDGCLIFFGEDLG